MGVNDRLFEPPAQDAAKIEARLATLPPQLQALVQRANDALVRNDHATAQRALTSAMMIAPGQPDVLRLYALLLAQIGNFTAAAANFEEVLRAVPDDAFGYWQYAQVCEQAGDIDAAARLRRQAVERLPDSPLAWADLGEHQSSHEDIESSLVALKRATQLAPGYAPAHLKLGSALVACGRVEEGAAEVRHALRCQPEFGAAWLSLVDIKTVPITQDEMQQMHALLRGRDLDESERTAVGFALARACEDAGLFHEAFDCFVDANARRRREVGGWKREPFAASVERGEQVFGATHAMAPDPSLGSEAIFIVGMPRSGTTLIERILASHSQVQAGGELGALAQVLTEESTRLQLRYPEWVPATTAGDWERLGRRYLDLTARLREYHPRFTDKMPSNWQALGAIRAMLPGARIVICRRDPLENCWSCFRQYFPQGWEFTYDLGDVASFWKAFNHAASTWGRRAPDHVREQGYETLIGDPEAETRRLLDFCGLPFEDAALRFHELPGSVRTLSAAQVRQPIHRHAGRAAAYGALLDPLRIALGLPLPTSTKMEKGQVSS